MLRRWARNGGRWAVLAVLVASPLSAGGPSADEARSLAWLRAQITPNAVVSAPDPQRRGLVLSYAPGTQPPGPLHRRAFTYDQALAAIAFTTSGDLTSASRVLGALARAQRKDGSFWFSYNVQNTWPEEGDHDMAIVRSGAMAWAGYAFAFYLEHSPAADDPRRQRERATFTEAARRTADLLLGLRVSDAKALARGLVRGGHAAVNLGTDAAGKAAESYDDTPIRWVSTEHNIGTFFFLSALGRVTGEEKYRAAAQEIRARVLAVLWQEDLGQFAQGVLAEDKIDRARALDCASWGALFLVAIGERARAERALATAEKIYAARDGGVEGHRPYSDRPVYLDARVSRLFFPEQPPLRWETVPLVWSEGSLGVALAEARLGHAARARKITAQMLKLRQGDGLRLASRKLPYEMDDSASIAGTAWHVLVEGALREPKKDGVWSR